MRRRRLNALVSAAAVGMALIAASAAAPPATAVARADTSAQVDTASAHAMNGQ